MPGRGWSKNTLIKYTLLQIPMTLLIGLVLFWMREKTGLSLGLIWTILGVWIGKDVVLFFFLWPAYEDRPHNDKLSLIGRVGVARDRLAPSGYIRLNGTLWKARVSEGEYHVDEGSKVRIVHRNGLTLEVEPVGRDKE